MKKIIIYASSHHQNTKKVVEAICQMDEITAYNVSDAELLDLEDYDYIGIASGMYMAKIAEPLYQYLQKNKEKLKGKKVFTIYTSGSGNKKYQKTFDEIIRELNMNSMGAFSCKGFDTYGFWKVIGGISKNHPNAKDLENAKNFYKKLK